MNPRPKFEDIFLSLADNISKRSTCSRLSVGCVITSTDFRKVLSVGYNGNAQGLDNCCDSSEPGNCGCLHAEINACINCDSPRSIEKIVFVTHLPCVNCSKALINLGNVRTIFYKNDYRINKSLELFQRAGIIVYKTP